jgi:Thioredoxin-like [2Fe-2S] ferredoxin
LIELKSVDVQKARVESVVQFYSFLYDQPRGRYRILLSDNITDRMLGSLPLFEHMLRLKLRRAIYCNLIVPATNNNQAMNEPARAPVEAVEARCSQPT